MTCFLIYYFSLNAIYIKISCKQRYSSRECSTWRYLDSCAELLSNHSTLKISSLHSAQFHEQGKRRIQTLCINFYSFVVLKPRLIINTKQYGLCYIAIIIIIIKDFNIISIIIIVIYQYFASKGKTFLQGNTCIILFDYA